MKLTILCSLNVDLLLYFSMLFTYYFYFISGGILSILFASSYVLVTVITNTINDIPLF